MSGPPVIHGQNEGLFLGCMNIGCAIAIGIVLLFVALIVLAGVFSS